MQKNIIGAIFPISIEHAKRLFDEKRNVFVKYTIMNKLEKNSKIIFYVSKEKVLMGEGTIEKIEKLQPEVAWARYGNQIFLNETEYQEYFSKSPIDGRKRKMVEITVFVLKNLKKFDLPVSMRKKGLSADKSFTRDDRTKIGTPSGCYLTKEDYGKFNA